MITEGLERLAEHLAGGLTTSRALTEACLARIAAADGEGARAFPFGASARALEDADVQDRLRREGRIASPFAGIPIAVKDNVDQAGQVTRAGTRLLDQDPSAAADAPVVARLRAAGFVVVGRTNMTELAFSGLGLNPHYGTPANPRGTDAARIPGGSSSGSAVAVAAGMASAAVGTDTGGSCRIPAAFCGLVGFKPTGARIPRDGVFALSTTLDCVGSLGVSVTCCAVMDAVMAGEADLTLSPRPLHGLTLGALQGAVLADLEPAVALAYEAALKRLRQAGVAITPVTLEALGDIARINAKGGFSAGELYAHLGARLEAHADLVDPRVLRRVRLGAGLEPADYAAMQAIRSGMIAKVDAALSGFDAILTPTTPVVAPRFDELDADEDYARINGLALRNPSIANLLDRPAISIPCETTGALPVGLSLMGRTGEDRALLALAAGLESVIRGT
ncbi:MAG: amidase [Caulobacteraceae bacterium]|nr:amidase [Caulobacteraceae bacterium]